MSAAIKALRAAVFARAGGFCESCGIAHGESGHLDHFFGRAKAPETIENCWALCLKCDHEKTTNDPSSAAWCDRFYLHAVKHGYHEAAERAVQKLRWQEAKRLPS